jgi:hypothetical protein
MSSSRIHFRESYMDVSDAAMGVWLRLLVGAIEAIQDPAPWLVAARDDWNEAATMGAGFGVIPELDGFVDDEERRKVVLGLCELASQRLREMGDPVPAATLNALGAGPADSRFERDVPAAVFRGVAEEFTKLLRDTALNMGLK